MSPVEVDLGALRQLAVELAAEAGAVTRSPLLAAPGTPVGEDIGFVLAAAPGVAAALAELLAELGACPPASLPGGTPDIL